jgi:hypothetical protein
MQASYAIRPAMVGEKMAATARQVWLAGLGAAVVTRDWAEKEAGHVFRQLVREGTAVESRAIRVVGKRVETSVTRANAILRQARGSLQGTVKDYTDGAMTIVRKSLPAGLPRIELPAMLRPAATAKPAKKRPAKTVRAKAVKRVKQAKRAGRPAAKRAAKR